MPRASRWSSGQILGYGKPTLEANSCKGPGLLGGLVAGSAVAICGQLCPSPKIANLAGKRRWSVYGAQLRIGTPQKLTIS